MCSGPRMHGQHPELAIWNWPTASGAGHVQFGSRHAPQHPEPAICSLGPGVAHCIRSREEDRSDSAGEDRG